MTEAETADHPIVETCGAEPDRRVLLWSGPVGRGPGIPHSPRVEAGAPTPTTPGSPSSSSWSCFSSSRSCWPSPFRRSSERPQPATARSAQANLNTAFTDAKTQYENDNQTYYVNGVQDSAAFANLLDVAQLSLTFHAGSAGTTTATGSSGSASVVSVSVSVDGNGLVMANYAKPGSCFYLVDNTGGISSASSSVAPYTGATAVTTSPVVAPAGTIGLPSGTGVSYVSVLGDYNANDCNAYSPMTSGSPATVQYSTSGYPS